MTKYIDIKTQIPYPEDVKDYNKLLKYEARSMFGQLPIFWDRTDDFLVYDRHGNRFIDFTSGICVANIGHGNTSICNGLRSLINQPLLHTYTFPTKIRLQYLKELIHTCYPKGKAFLVSSGTEAIEVAVKLMKMWGLRKNEYTDIIISFKGAMHGRTMLAEQLKGKTNDNQWAMFHNPSIYNFDVPDKSSSFSKDLELIKPKIGIHNITGFIIESYQGWSAYFYPKSYIQELVRFANKNDILVCFDEIQGGFGRTGRMWAWEHYDIPIPDLICFGKGASSSIPLSGVIGRKKILDIPEFGSMSSTHSANPLSCMAGLWVLKELKSNNLIEESKQKGLILHRELKKIWKDVRGKGLLASLITKNKMIADKIAWKCMEKGLLVIWTNKNSVKIAPPLTIKLDALIEGLQILKETINEI